MIEKSYREYIEKQSVEGLQKVIQRMDKNKYPEHYTYVMNKLSDKMKDNINLRKDQSTDSSIESINQSESSTTNNRIEQNTC